MAEKKKAEKPEKINLTVDIEDLTLDEVVEIEELTGASLDQMGTVNRGLMVKSLAFITLKRDDPSLTWEDVGQMKMGMIDLGEA